VPGRGQIDNGKPTMTKGYSTMFIHPKTSIIGTAMVESIAHNGNSILHFLSLARPVVSKKTCYAAHKTKS
jgi:hypothetical protein